VSKTAGADEPAPIERAVRAAGSAERAAGVTTREAVQPPARRDELMAAYRASRPADQSRSAG
jgi:hypothetical protein